jgi:hypothetical protein
MAIQLRLCQGAVHIPEHPAQFSHRAVTGIKIKLLNVILVQLDARPESILCLTPPVAGAGCFPR